MTCRCAECAVNPHGNCPKCGSNLIDHIDSNGGTDVLYHCAQCGTWYDEEGHIQNDDID